MTIHEMQNLNRSAIDYIISVIKPGMTLLELRQLAEDFLLANGADSFWYWDVGAFIFSGDETTLSVSGKTYRTADRVIGRDDIVTVDLSPQRDNIWGDFARTIILEDGVVVKEIDTIQNREWREGMQMEEKLHQVMREFVTVDTTFEELYFYINEIITTDGYINLDFLGNLGHSIVKEKSDRIYTEKGNRRKLSSVEAFTFEPHISLPGSKYGYKKENIYAFSEGVLYEL